MVCKHITIKIFLLILHQWKGAASGSVLVTDHLVVWLINHLGHGSSKYSSDLPRASHTLTFFIRVVTSITPFISTFLLPWIPILEPDSLLIFHKFLTQNSRTTNKAQSNFCQHDFTISPFLRPWQEQQHSSKLNSHLCCKWWNYYLLLLFVGVLAPK